MQCSAGCGSSFLRYSLLFLRPAPVQPILGDERQPVEPPFRATETKSHGPHELCRRYFGRRRLWPDVSRWQSSQPNDTPGTATAHSWRDPPSLKHPPGTSFP
ncbi:hypothetical protein VDGL01_01758 [Verticillium dahliae]